MGRACLPQAGVPPGNGVWVLFCIGGRSLIVCLISGGLERCNYIGGRQLILHQLF